MFLNRRFLTILFVLISAYNLLLVVEPSLSALTSPSVESEPSLQTAEDHAEYRHLLLRESARNAKNLGDTARSLELYHELVTEFPENKPDLREYLGALMQFGKMADAAVILEKELITSPTDQDSLRMMVDAQLGLRQLDRAEVFAQKLVQLNPSDTATQLKLALLFVNKKQWKLTTTILQNLQTVSPDVLRSNSPFALDLAEIHLVFGDDTTAGTYLLPILKTGKFTAEWESRRALLLAVWFYATQQNGPKVDEYRQKLDEVDVATADYLSRFHLINVLLDHRLDTIARQMAEQLARKLPDNPECFLTLARIDIMNGDDISAIHHIDRAERLLAEYPPTYAGGSPNHRLSRLLYQTKISLHEMKSEHILQRRLLREIYSDPAAILSCWKSLADTYSGTGEYDKAEVIYRQVITEVAQTIQQTETMTVNSVLDCSQLETEAVLASQKLLESLSHQRKAHELSNTYWWICGLFPDLPPTRRAAITLTYCRAMIRHRRVDTVAPILEEMAQQPWCHGEQKSLAIAMLGDTVFYRGDWTRAMSLYEEAANLSRGNDVVVYGMIRILCHERLEYKRYSVDSAPPCETNFSHGGTENTEKTPLVDNHPSKPRQISAILESQLSGLPNSAAVAVIVSVYYRAMDDGDKYTASQILNAAQNIPHFHAESNPNFMAALGHWYFTTGDSCGSYTTAIHIFNELCGRYPDNIAFRKSLLDSYSAARQFGNALKVQRKLLENDPYHLEYDLIGLRIRAGLVETFEAESLYNGAIHKRRNFALDLPEWQSTSTVTTGHYDGVPFPSQFPAANLTEEMKRRDILILALEREAWVNRVNRPETSNGYYEQQRNLRLYDETIPYQMGVNCDAVSWTSEACVRYRQSLQVNPYNKYDHFSLDADAWRLRPKISAGYEFLGKHGRGGLADIRLHQIPAEMTVLCNNQDEYMAAGYGRTKCETRFEDYQFSGNSFLCSYRKRFDPCRHWQFFTDLEVTEYDQHIATRPMGDFGVLYNPRRDYSVGVAGRLQQVLENAGTIHQDIYRYGFSTFGEWRPTTRWKMDGSIDYFRYSDTNDLTQLSWNHKYLLWNGPKHRFDVLSSWQFQDFSESVTAAEPDILAMRHPYFAPSGYHVFDVGVRWEWQLCKHPYHGIQETMVFLEYRHRWDTRNVHYDTIQTGCLWEVSQRLRLEGAFRCISSQPYDEYGVMVGGTWRF